MSDEFILNLLTNGGPLVTFAIILLWIAVGYSRHDTYRRKVQVDEQVKQQDHERDMAESYHSGLLKAQEDYNRLQNEIRQEANDLQKRLFVRIDALDKQVAELENANDGYEDALKDATRQNLACQETLEHMSKERDQYRVERDKSNAELKAALAREAGLEDANSNLLARLASYEQIQTDLGKQVRELVQQRDELNSKVAGQAETIARMEHELTAIGHSKLSPKTGDRS